MNLEGHVICDRRLANHPLWLQKPFGEGQAMWDLVLLANNRDVLERLDGADVAIARGHSAWTERGLADRWGWGRTKTHGFLRSLERRGTIAKVTGTAGARTLWKIVNYDLYNPLPETPKKALTAPPASHPQASDAPPASHPQTQNGNKEEEREGGFPRAESGVPSEAEVRDWAGFAGIPPDYAAQLWARVTEEHRWLIHGRVFNWKARWVRYWAEDRDEWLAGKKNAAAPGASRRFDGRDPDLPPPVPGAQPATLAQLQEALR